MPEESAAPVELETRDEGTGPAVLLLHGVGGNHALWNTVTPPFSSGHRLLCPDLRGHGRTASPPGSTYSLAELEGDVLAYLDARSVPNVHLIGLSGGALLALRLTLDHPERVRSLTMISGAAYIDPHTRSVAQRWEEIYRAEGPDALALRMLKDLYYPDWIEAHLDFADQIRAIVPQLDLAPALEWAKATLQFDERKRIASVDRPTLIVQAMDDQVIDASHGRILRQSIAGAQIRIFAQTGHMIPVERPAETGEALAKFLTEVEGNGPNSGPA